jgi:hypothetical protein
MDYTKMTGSFAKQAVRYDQGLRSYMLSVYNYMAVALGITGVVAFLVGNVPALTELFIMSPLRWLFVFAPLLMIFFVMPRMMSFSLQGAQMAFWTFAGLMGVSMGSIFLVYTGSSIASTFFISASVFGSMSLYGYTTKKDLSSWGSFLMMGLIGMIIASLVNIFLQSSAMQFVLSFVGVIVFIGLTAYDTQRIKEIYYQVSGNGEVASKFAIFGALSLYMDFINLFIQLLQLFGDRK